ncbi:MAG: YraN family protein [Galactobacter sp.]
MTTTTTRSAKAVPTRPDPKELGRRGEVFALGWLTGHGYTVLERNWRCRLGELDVVAQHEGDLVAVEVKTRSGDGYGAPAEAVNREKLARLHRLVLAYAREALGPGGSAPGSLPSPLPVSYRRRVDVLSLVWPPGDPVPSTVELYRAVTP